MGRPAAEGGAIVTPPHVSHHCRARLAARGIPDWAARRAVEVGRPARRRDGATAYVIDFGVVADHPELAPYACLTVVVAADGVAVTAFIATGRPPNQPGRPACHGRDWRRRDREAS